MNRLENLVEYPANSKSDVNIFFHEDDICKYEGESNSSIDIKCLLVARRDLLKNGGADLSITDISAIQVLEVIISQDIMNMRKEENDKIFFISQHTDELYYLPAEKVVVLGENYVDPSLIISPVGPCCDKNCKECGE